MRIAYHFCFVPDQDNCIKYIQGLDNEIKKKNIWNDSIYNSAVTNPHSLALGYVHMESKPELLRWSGRWIVAQLLVAIMDDQRK